MSDTDRRLRVAWVSPLPPQRSGIADYSAELLPHLARHLDLELYVEPGVVAEGVAGLAIRPLSELPARLGRGEIDLAVYHLGNNADYHAQTYRTLLAHPGVVVLHETMLHHLVRGLTLDRGDRAAYLEEHRYAAGRTGWVTAQRSLDSGLPFDHWSYPLFERVVDRSLGVLVHNEHARRRVLDSRPRARVGKVPMPVDVSALPSASREEARRRLGVPAEAFVVASFGFITPAKRLPVSLRAFARLRRRRPDALYLLVGEVSPHYDLGRWLEGETGQGVRLLGRVPMEELLTAMVATDVAVNLRHPAGGETSATFMRLLALGVPTLVTDAGSFQEVPPGACARVPLDDAEEDLVTAYLEELAASESLRRAMGENAKRWIREGHGFGHAVRAYVSFLEEARSWPTPLPAVPPLAPYPPEDVATELLARTAAAACDLGVGEEDEEVLRAVAEAVAGLGITV